MTDGHRGVPPHHLEAERAILGMMLLDADSVPQALRVLAARDFFKDSHRIMFEAIAGLSKRGEPVDLLTVREELRRRDQFEYVGGEVMLAALVEEASTLSHLPTYAKSVREKAIRREFIELAGRLAKDLANPGADVWALLDGMVAGTEAAKDSFRSLRGGVGKERDFRPVGAAELLAREPEPTAWVWDRYIPEGRLVLISAFMKVGKSVFTQALAVSVARGQEFLGFRTNPKGVLILALEEHPDDVNRRLRRFGLRPDDPIHLYAGSLDDTPATLRQVQDFITRNGIKLLVVDTLGRFWKLTDENDNAEVTRVVSPLLDLARETGAAVVLVHHERKAGGEDGRAIRGASALLGLVDQALSLDRRHGGRANQRVLRAIGRYDETPRELVIELAGNIYRKLGTPAELDLGANKDLVWGILTGQPQTIKDLASKTLLTPHAVRRALAALVGVIQEGSGKKGAPYTYRLPPDDSIPDQADPIQEETNRSGSPDHRVEVPGEEWA